MRPLLDNCRVRCRARRDRSGSCSESTRSHGPFALLPRVLDRGKRRLPLRGRPIDRCNASSIGIPGNFYTQETVLAGCNFHEALKRPSMFLVIDLRIDRGKNNRVVRWFWRSRDEWHNAPKI